MGYTCNANSTIPRKILLIGSCSSFSLEEIWSHGHAYCSIQVTQNYTSTLVFILSTGLYTDWWITLYSIFRCNNFYFVCFVCISLSLCPTFGGNNPGVRAELIHSLREEVSVICGCALVNRPSAFASISVSFITLYSTVEFFYLVNFVLHVYTYIHVISPSLYTLKSIRIPELCLT